MQRCIDRHHIADADHGRGVWVEVDAKVFLDCLGQAVAVGVMQCDVERPQPAQHRAADPARADGSDLHPLDIVGARDTVGDIPAAIDDQLVGGDVVSHQRQDHHHLMLGHADRIAVGHLGDGDAAVHRGLQIDMVGPDAGGDRKLKLVCLGDPFLGQIGP